jgi:hypothetical protein
VYIIINRNMEEGRKTEEIKMWEEREDGWKRGKI